MIGYDQSRDERMRKEGVSLIPILLHPKSKGEVKLRNSFPLSTPIIDPHYLEDPDDLKVLVEVSMQMNTYISEHLDF